MTEPPLEGDDTATNDVIPESDAAPTARSEVGANLAAAIVHGAEATAAFTDADIATGKSAAELKGKLDDLDLRKKYAKWLLIAMGAELGLVNGIFFWYGIAN